MSITYTLTRVKEALIPPVVRIPSSVKNEDTFEEIQKKVVPAHVRNARL